MTARAWAARRHGQSQGAMLSGQLGAAWRGSAWHGTAQLGVARRGSAVTAQLRSAWRVPSRLRPSLLALCRRAPLGSTQLGTAALPSPWPRLGQPLASRAAPVLPTDDNHDAGVPGAPRFLLVAAPGASRPLLGTAAPAGPRHRSCLHICFSLGPAAARPGRRDGGSQRGRAGGQG